MSDDPDIESNVEIVQPFEKLRPILSKFDSDYKQREIFKQNGFIQPTEIVIESKTCGNYVPLLQTLKTLQVMKMCCPIFSRNQPHQRIL